MSSDESLQKLTNLTKQLQIARSEISNLRQQIKALQNSNRKDYEDINTTLQSFQCPSCKSQQQILDKPGPSNLQKPESEDKYAELNYIGYISTDFPEKRGTPRQPNICPTSAAKLVLTNVALTNPEHALEGLEEFSHMWIIFHFHRNENHSKAKVAPPRLNGIRTGLFATRSPHRPCPIGLSLVKIERIAGKTIYFSGVDMVHGTPVFDLKPYIPQYDTPDGCFGEGDVNLEGSSRSRDVEASSRILDGEENSGRGTPFGAVGYSLRDQQQLLQENFPGRSDSRIGEREAPDGEEEETTSQTTPSNQNTSFVRIPQWINQPTVTALTVLFKDRALLQLQELGSEGEEKKQIIMNVLREDPRSVYLRERWGSHCYVFRIAELFVSCKFNHSTNSVTVYQIFQNSAPEYVEE